ncbi:hypothetical protein [Bradyrhizobium sp. DOA9]|uniref:hypothetical protein n=1 Tax=Bradyrhizobium sp. DOA9 TaxID=1126627 RepID=UPI00046AE3A2|nr:hypothetical protein [Bradyrhizobium sp. DOA9]GAJ35131.1 hypothetical protein BDOA9_0143300 [Bradyrhizobium sp. DOA9]
MRRPDAYPLLRIALTHLRWDDFQSARELAGRLERWSVDSVRDQLQLLESEGLLWSIVEEGRLSTHKWAHVCAGTAELIIPAGGRRSVRRTWRPVGRVAA